MLTLPRHHIPSLFQILRAIVCSPDFIGINMRQCSFYDVRLKPLLIENSLSNRSHTMRYKDIFEAHTFQRHVCRLTVHLFQWIAITGKNVWSVLTNRLHNFQYDKCLLRQWNNVHAFHFHTPSRNAPFLCFKADLVPPGHCGFGWPCHSKKLTFDKGTRLSANIYAAIALYF